MKQYDLYGIGNALVDLEFRVSDEKLAALEVDKGLMTLIEEDRHHDLLDTTIPSAVTATPANALLW